MTQPTQHILLVEDDPAIATSLKVTFKREGWQLTWLDNTSNVLPTIQQLNQSQQLEHANLQQDSIPLSAIILDVGLPDGDGLSLCKSIRDSDTIGYVKDLPILFLTARSDEIDRILGLEMGADDYCPKPFSPKELVARLKAIWRRQTMFNDHLKTHLADATSVTELPENSSQPENNNQLKTNNQPQIFQLISGTWEYQPTTYRLSWQGQKLELSNTERKLLLFMLENATQVLNREQLLSAISEYPDHRLARTIDSHIKAIRKQISQVNATVEVVYTHRGIGYGLCVP